MNLSADEFYSMTWGNYNRKAYGYVKRLWITDREVIAAILSQRSQQPVTGEDVFPFGIVQEKMPPPTDEDRQMMKLRHENTMRLINGRS